MATFRLAQIKRFVCAGMLLLFPLLVSARQMYWTAEARDAYSLILSLRIDEGLNLVRLHAISQPDNQIWPYLEDYGAFLRIFVQEDLRQIPSFLESSSRRLSRVANVPDSNPLSLMAQGQILLHQCALRLQQGKFIAAASDINKAFKLLKKNQKLHPSDVANLRLFGALKVVFGAIPDQYRWLVSIVSSLSGTIEEGLKDLHSILRTTTRADNIYYDETVMFTALAEGRMNNRPEYALSLVHEHLGSSPTSRGNQYLMAGLMLANGNNDETIDLLLRPAGPPGATRIPFLDFMLGECKLFRGDADADDYLKRFLAHHKGKHFIKEAYQKLAWHALLAEDRTGYFSYLQQILIKGSATTDEDQQALHEAENHATPHPILLRSRLYYDGGYYEQAIMLLTEEFYGTLKQHAHRLEFLYRKGRILQAQKSYPEALHYLNLTITTGQFSKYYFSCSAALQCGIIHESLGSPESALKFYTLCLQMIPDTYATSLHQKARMGINRVD